ncbi:hypothetical protein MLD38_025493 [Melastoma candidum]|uniref:Uncharacterized protein n=1 Tax=Melastoma candidum TaxID=119954 RepID=A0ACB9NWY3_9MYRT|nr:hypothetical protein MLD38_025493 [Melastoma candidum]
MLLTSLSLQAFLGPSHHHTLLFYSNKPLPSAVCSSLSPKPLSLPSSSSSSSPLRHVTSSPTADDDDSKTPGAQQAPIVPSASAVASAILNCSTSPVEFVQMIQHHHKSGLVLPSADFQRLCVEQLDLFLRIVRSDALLSVYVRPAGSYVMDRLELRRVILYPGPSTMNATETVILIGSFNVPAGLRAAEAMLSSKQAEEVAESSTVVFPLVKHPFVVGFLVAEFPSTERDLPHYPSPDEAYTLPHAESNLKSKKRWKFKNRQSTTGTPKLSVEQRMNAINIARSLAMAYVMDQKAMLLQQSSWQNNVRMSNLLEQIRGPLSSIRTLSKMLSLHTKRSEIAFDIVEDILVQGDQINDTLQQLQDAVHLTKANIMHYNEESMKKIQATPHSAPVRYSMADSLSQVSAMSDLEMPMPPLALTPLRKHEIRPCNVADVLSDLVGAVRPLANKQQRALKLSELSKLSPVAVEEPAFRQALSNLIEGALLRTHIGGRVEILATAAPAGGVLIVIDDDGPDMHYMTQMHSLTPFGPDLCSDSMVEDNMTWNFIAGLSVARDILESYGGVVRVISPRRPDAALGSGGTRVELWLPSFTPLSDVTSREG